MAHGGDTNLIHSCVKNSNGSIRIVGPNDACGSNETALDWSRNGIGTFGGFTTNQLVGYYAVNDSFDYRLFDGANFTNAYMSSVSIGFASFLNTNFSNARLDDMSMENSNFAGSNFSNVNITDTTFITNSDFSNTNFTSATFSGQNTIMIQNANFTNANFTNAVLLGVDFTSTTRTGITWSNTTCPDGTNSDNYGNTCEGHLTP